MKILVKILSLLLIPTAIDAQQITVKSINGMVVSAHPIASFVGVDVLRKGGNAVDAAVAVEFALAVVYPNAGNIGGDGFLVYRGTDGKRAALDYRETAPAQADCNMYLDEDKNPIADKSLYGALAVGVPGTVAGMVAVHKEYGSLSWGELIEPAIQLANNGFVITEKQAIDLNANRQYFLKHNPNGCAFLKEQEWRNGDVLIQKDLVKTLRLIRDQGRDGFYRGETAEAIVGQMKRGAGIISLEDLNNYQAIWREPIVEKYNRYNVISMPSSIEWWYCPDNPVANSSKISSFQMGFSTRFNSYAYG